MRHLTKTACMLTMAVCFADGAFAQGTSTGGAPPATHSSSNDSGGGQSAAIKGGAGTAGEYGTDPATLKKVEAARQAKEKAKQPGAPVSK